MIENYCRRYAQAYLIDPIATYLKNKISPNALTILSGSIILLLVPCVLYQRYWLGCLVLVLSGILDILDGTVARLIQQSTHWGTVLDITMDRFVEFMIVFCLWLVDPVNRGFIIIMMLGSMLLCITSFLVVGIFIENDSNKGFHYSPGLMERAEAFVFFILMLCLPTQFQYLALLFVILVLLTAFIRLYEFRKYHCRYS